MNNHLLRGNYWFILVIVILGITVFGRILFNGFVGDDLGYINHPYIQNFQITELFSASSTDLGGSSLITGHFYRPVMLVLLSQLFQIGGESPWLYHLIQLGLHITNTILVYLLLVKFLPPKSAKILSLVFLVHPINTETVAYISNLQDILFVLFGLVAGNLMVRGKSTLTVALMLFLSLLAKETGGLFLACCLLYIWYTRSKDLREWIYRLSGVTAAYLLLRLGVAGIGIGGLQKTVMGSLSLGERVMHIPKIIMYYLQTMVWPSSLALGQTWVIKPGVGTVLIPGMVILICILILAKTIRSKSALYFAVWMVMGVALHLQIIPLEMTVADRWWYFPFIGCLGLVGSILPKRLILAFGVIIPLLAFRTWVRTGDFKDAITLYKHDSQITESYLLEQAYGYELMQNNDLTSARRHLEKSIYLFENSTNTNTLGVLFFRQNSLEEAISWFTRSVRLGDNFQAYNNLTRTLLAVRSDDQALKVAIAGTEKFPQSDNFWYLLAITQYRRTDYPKALTAAQRAVTLSPSQQNRYVLNQLLTGQEIKFSD